MPSKYPITELASPQADHDSAGSGPTELDQESAEHPGERQSATNWGRSSKQPVAARCRAAVSTATPSSGAGQERRPTDGNLPGRPYIGRSGASSHREVHQPSSEVFDTVFEYSDGTGEASGVARFSGTVSQPPSLEAWHSDRQLGAL
jgi:hypothetical protein